MMATRAPARARPRAIPRPMPPLPPVTSADFPVKLKRLVMLHLRSIEKAWPGLFSNHELLLSLRVSVRGGSKKFWALPRSNRQRYRDCLLEIAGHSSAADRPLLAA